MEHYSRAACLFLAGCTAAAPSVDAPPLTVPDGATAPDATLGDAARATAADLTQAPGDLATELDLAQAPAVPDLALWPDLVPPLAPCGDLTQPCCNGTDCGQGFVCMWTGGACGTPAATTCREVPRNCGDPGSSCCFYDGMVWCNQGGVNHRNLCVGGRCVGCP